MINAELNHNPYLLQTSVKFNGQSPRINSQVEKYAAITLTDWIDRVPQIFHDEMNGYDFDFYFTGTKSDFERLQNTFSRAGVTQDMVRLIHKNMLEDAETKSHAIDALIQWLRENPNRKFDFEEFFSSNSNLFEGSYSYIIMNGPASENIHPQVSMELIKDANELQNTVLFNTPILFFIDPSLRKKSREYLKCVLRRKDVKQNQLFFMIHPQLNTEQVKRVIIDLGVEEPQIVTSYGDDSIMKYFQNYPITEYVRNAIIVLEECVQQISESLEAENKERKIQNSEIRNILNGIEEQINLLKKSALHFSERDNFSAGNIFSNLLGTLQSQISTWRNNKTKINGDEKCAIEASQYDKDVAKFMTEFDSAAKSIYRQTAARIHHEFQLHYSKQGLDLDFEPIDVFLPDPVDCKPIYLTHKLIALKKITYEEPKFDLAVMWRTAETKESVRVVTCFYDEWRKKALALILPKANKCIEKNIEQLCNYYNELAEAYSVHLHELIAIQEAKKDNVSAQLSVEERKLQEDNDWLSVFKDQLTHIERG